MHQLTIKDTQERRIIMNAFYQNRDEEYSVTTTINNTYPLHLHRQVEMIYVKSGQLRVTIDDETYILNAGDLSITFPNRPHSTESIGDSEAVLMIFNPEFAGGYINELSRRKPAVPVITDDKVPYECTYAIDHILECCSEGRDFRIAQGYMHIILGCIMPLLTMQSEVETSDSVDMCHKIIEYIAENFKEDMSLDSVSHELGLNKYYISHIFSDKIHESFPAYLGRCRSEHAARLLKTTHMTVTDIGYASGFNSSRTFYRAFQRVYGVTPQEYRNL